MLLFEEEDCVRKDREDGGRCSMLGSVDELWKQGTAWRGGEITTGISVLSFCVCHCDGYSE